eukprot:CAMPEP_0184307096 /NCGR_PEP_ID=MMETSP1049-20130417/15927_1 /TAXON_ID=77928 /ORGANISM="Proteomonas sulcata, Strain CCMP704" /LENGTH=63 /DNA_ID=CAMNT_0026619501 /DNA_START=780 /DNA_END=971 /DNA_ORIENTATION=-
MVNCAFSVTITPQPAGTPLRNPPRMQFFMNNTTFGNLRNLGGIGSCCWKGYVKPLLYLAARSK